MRSLRSLKELITPALLTVLGIAPVLAPATPALAAVGSVPLPFDQGAAVRIIQGYNGGTHQAASVYGLDLVLASGETSGAPVLSPFDGTVPWAFAPGEKTGCIEILAQDRTFGTMLCHVILDRPFGRGERVARGQQLGTVGAAGMVGNNGTPHVHMELHGAGRSSNIVPFSLADGGLPLDGWDLPATGASNDHGGEGLLMSSNALASAPVAQAPTPKAGPAPLLVKGCGPGATPTFGLGFAELKTHLGDMVGAATTCEFADPSGSGDVLQQTSNGLAFWRKSSNTATFTNGNQHWAFTSSGWVQWTGSSIDPPTAGGPGAN
ncbi:MAG TPA: M23 family metallopeptidase [Chloroflexota bacterium]|nr:M23 family metallopeptidase [Chloroflexota bacterium]